jgi:hypothetical protein
VIPQFISATDAAAKLGITTKTLRKLGFTRYEINERVIRYLEAEIMYWIEKRAMSVPRYVAAEYYTQQTYQQKGLPRTSKRKSSKLTVTEELAHRLNIHRRKF